LCARRVRGCSRDGALLDSHVAFGHVSQVIWLAAAYLIVDRMRRLPVPKPFSGGGRLWGFCDRWGGRSAGGGVC